MPNLILDGPNEMIAKKVSQMQMENKESIQLERERMKAGELISLRKTYINSLISYLAGKHNIKPEQAKILLRDLPDQQIRIIEMEYLKKSKRWVWLTSATLNLVVGIGATAIHPALILLAFFSLLFSFTTYNESFYAENRRLLSKKCGKDYFPFEELRALLHK